MTAAQHVTTVTVDIYCLVVVLIDQMVQCESAESIMSLRPVFFFAIMAIMKQLSASIMLQMHHYHVTAVSGGLLNM